jgi:mannosyltransferase OCH1-like enzyme
VGFVIPKILHRVALGTVPEKLDQFWDEWAELHPDWELMSWTGPLIVGEWELGHQFTRAKAFSEIGDMLSAEVVWRYGGVYVDWDMQPLKSLDSFVEGREAFYGSEGGGWYSHAIFGASKNHASVRALVDGMMDVNFDLPPNQSTGPHLYTKILKTRADAPLVDKEVFYPVNVDQQQWQAGLTRVEIASHFPESYTTHHWAHSWKNFTEGDMSIYNQQTLEEMVIEG